MAFLSREQGLQSGGNLWWGGRHPENFQRKQLAESLQIETFCQRISGAGFQLNIETTETPTSK